MPLSALAAPVVAREVDEMESLLRDAIDTLHGCAMARERISVGICRSNAATLVNRINLFFQAHRLAALATPPQDSRGGGE
jgi:hypothetical protein